MALENTKQLSAALVLILVIRLGLGIAYSALNPLGEAPDEADHYAYVTYIGREGGLPVGSTVTQGKHPPLYYLAAAAVTRWTGLDFSFLRSNPDVGWTAAAAAPNAFVHTTLEDWPWQGGALAMHLARLVSVLTGLALTAGTYALGCALWPRRPFVALAAAAFVACLPEALFVGGSVSNDMPAAALATWALWAALRGRRSHDAALAGVFMGLAVLTKVSAVALWPVILLALLLPADDTEQAGRTPTRNPQGLVRAALAGSVALLIIAPWLWRNWQLYGDPLGTPVVLATIDRRLVPLTGSNLLWLIRGWFYSFWGRFGAVGHLALPWPLYALWAALLALAGGGWLRRIVRRPLQSRNPTRSLILLGAPLAVILTMISYSQIALGTDQGRLLFPALAPIALLLTGGLAAWLPDRLSTHLSWFADGLAALMVGVAVVALNVGIIRPFAPPAAPATAALAAAQPVGQRFGGDLELVAVQWGAVTQVAGQPETQLTLHWQARRPLEQDLRTSLRLVDRSGEPIWEWKRSPGAGRFSTDRWPAGRVVADLYRIPEAALQQAERIEVGVRSFPEDVWLSIASRPDASPYLLLPRPE